MLKAAAPVPTDVAVPPVGSSVVTPIVSCPVSVVSVKYSVPVAWAPAGPTSVGGDGNGMNFNPAPVWYRQPYLRATMPVALPSASSAADVHSVADAKSELK